MFSSLNRSSHQQSEHTLPDTWRARNLVPPEVSARYLQGIPGSHMQLPSISLGWCVTRLRLSIEINLNKRSFKYDPFMVVNFLFHAYVRGGNRYLLSFTSPSSQNSLSKTFEYLLPTCGLSLYICSKFYCTVSIIS